MMKNTRNIMLLIFMVVGAAAAQEPTEQINHDDMARELANPNTSLASLTLKPQFMWFDGNLPAAGQQSGCTLLFQPVLPFPLQNGSQLMLRPAVPFILERPVPSGAGTYQDKSGIGDISFDVAYAFPSDPDDFFNLKAIGAVSSLPTATDSSLGNGQWTLGPEVLLGRMTSSYLAGVFPSHQWSVAGWGDNDVNLTSIQPIFSCFPGGGWNVGTSPAITYDWESEQWTIPLQLSIGKTLTINNRPWKLGCALSYYLERDDDFSSKWMLEFSITPVVKNILADLF